MARLLFPVAYQRLWQPRMAQLLQGLTAMVQSPQRHHQQPPKTDMPALTLVVKTCTKVCIDMDPRLYIYTQSSHDNEPPLCIPPSHNQPPRHPTNRPLPLDPSSLSPCRPTTPQILYYLAVQHADALDPSQLCAFLHDIHASLGPLLAAQRSLLQRLLLLPPHAQAQAPALAPARQMVALVGKLTKHLAKLVVELQKRAPLTLRGGLLPALLQLFWGELEGAAR